VTLSPDAKKVREECLRLMPKQPTGESMTQLFLYALKHEQNECIRLLPISKRNLEIKEGWGIQFALGKAVDAYRDLRDGKIDWKIAFERYNEVTAVTVAFGTALAVDDIFQERAAERAQVSAQLQSWQRKGWVVEIPYEEDRWELTEAGRAAIDEIRQIVEFG